jgi:peptidoglycan hydrolase CwlO-like protein
MKKINTTLTWLLASAIFISNIIVLMVENHDLKQEMETKIKLKDKLIFQLHRQLERCDERVVNLNNHIAKKEKRRGDSFIK